MKNKVESWVSVSHLPSNNYSALCIGYNVKLNNDEVKSPERDQNNSFTGGIKKVKVKV